MGNAGNLPGKVGGKNGVFVLLTDESSGITAELDSSGFLKVNLAAVFGDIPFNLVTVGGASIALGQTIGGESLPVVVASDQVVPVSSVSTTFDHGSNRDVDTSPEQITASAIAAKFGVLVKAARSNTANIYVGNSDVTADTTDATDGFELAPGESVLVKVNVANAVYVVAGANNQKIFWLAV